MMTQQTTAPVSPARPEDCAPGSRVAAALDRLDGAGQGAGLQSSVVRTIEDSRREWQATIDAARARIADARGAMPTLDELAAAAGAEVGLRLSEMALAEALRAQGRADATRAIAGRELDTLWHRVMTIRRALAGDPEPGVYVTTVDLQAMAGELRELVGD